MRFVGRRLGEILGQKPERAQVAGGAECAIIGGQGSQMNYRIISADDHIDLQWLPDAGDFWRAHGGLPLTMAPRAYFRRQVWATFQTDHVGLRLVDALGADRVMWASDYPHPDSTWPNSRQVIAAQMSGLSEATRRKVTCDNACALYRLS